MPYIDEESKQEIDPILDPFLAYISEKLNHPGRVNYIITRLHHEFVKANGGPSYSNFNAVAGILICALLEYYRRWIACYEDVKVLENGDVLPPWMTPWLGTVQVPLEDNTRRTE